MPLKKGDTPTFPNTRMISDLRARGYTVRCLWEIRGAPGTAWLTCYCINKPDGRLSVPLIVQTFEGDDGWEVWVPAYDGVDVEKTTAAVLRRLDDAQ